MMLTIIIKQLSDKLDKFLKENDNKYHVTSSWVNKWLADNGANYEAKIVGKDGREIDGATVLIEKKGGA